MARQIQRILKIESLKLLLAVGFFLAASLLFSHPTAHAANPTTINFQGKVVNTSDSTNVGGGPTFTFVFRLYQNVNIATYNPNTLSCAADANCYWEETDTLTVTNGVFQVELGAGCAFTSACNSGHSGIDFNSQNALSLTMKFSSDANGFMTPLMHLQSVPYALNADKLGGVAASGFAQLTPGAAQTLQPSVDATGLTVKGSGAGTTQNIFDVQTSGSANLIQATGVGALTLSSQGTTQTLSLSTAASTSVATGAITIQSGNASSGSNLNAGAITIDTGTSTGTGTAAINIGTTNAKALTIGNISASTTTSINGGTGATAIQLQVGASGTISVGTNAAANTIQIGDNATTNTGNTQTINIGNLNVAGTTNVTVGSTANATAGTTTVQGQGTVTLQSLGAGLTIDTTAAGQTTAIDNSAVTHTVQIATGAAVQTITIGSTNSTSPLTLQAGSSGATLKTTSTTALIIQSTTPTTLFTADTSGMIITIAGTTTTFADLTLDNAHFTSTQTNAPSAGTPTACANSPVGAVIARSTDSAGSFTIKAGTGTQTSTCQIVITFNKAYGTTPTSVILSPGTNVNSTTTVRTAAVTALSTTSFTVVMSGVATTAGTVYTWYYWVVE